MVFVMSVHYDIVFNKCSVIHRESSFLLSLVGIKLRLKDFGRNYTLESNPKFIKWGAAQSER